MRRLYLMSVGAAAIVGVAVGVLLHQSFAGGRAQAGGLEPPALLAGQATWPRGARPAPEIALDDQHGNAFTLGSVRGRAVALMFMDSLCKGMCPLEGRMMAASIGSVPKPLRPQVVVVSIDPGGDTPRSVAVALRKWRMPASTTWLLGSRAQLARVWKAYRIEVKPTGGDIEHTAALYLLDRRGDERAGFLMPFLPGLVAADLRKLGRDAV